MKRTLGVLLACMLAAPAAAQDGGRSAPDGGIPPASAIEGRPLPEGHPPVEAAEGQGGELPQGHPPVQGGSQAGSAPHGAASVANILAPPELGQAEENPELPAGTIRVTVVDVNGRPIADSPVDVGIRTQADDRARHNARTDADGRAVFEGLATGTSQAYRVNVPYLGATYSSAPFQLPTDRGYDVRITRLPVTRDDRFVFFNLFRVIVELREERLHIIHQAEITNAGHETYVFPVDGLRADLPHEALAFQAQRAMTDQRVEQIAGGGGYVLRGSLPPGTTRLAWAYDVPVDGSTMRIPVDVPLRFFTLQVFSEAPEGLVLDVAGMPPPQRVSNQGQAIWLTQVRRGPTDEPLERLTVTISGIPGPGPLRWIAVAVALLFVAGGIVLRLNRADDRAAARQALARRRAELLAEARALDAELEAGEVGPTFRQTRRAEIVRELASLLHEEEAAREMETASPAKPGARPARAR